MILDVSVFGMAGALSVSIVGAYALAYGLTLSIYALNRSGVLFGRLKTWLNS